MAAKKSAKKSGDTPDMDEKTRDAEDVMTGEDDKDASKYAKGKVTKADAKDDEDEDESGNDEGDSDSEDEDEDSDADEGDTKKSVKKSVISPMDLKKSIRRLRQFAEKHDGASRKQTLLEKAQSDSLTKSERAELFGLMDGSSRAEKLSEQMTKSLEQDETIQTNLELSDFLTAQHDGLIKSLGSLGEAVESQGNVQNEFNILLAKAVSTVGESMRALNGRLGALESAPVRAPKSQGARAMHKSFGGQPAAGEQMNKSQILGVLSQMNETSHSGGSNGLSKSGVDLTHAIAKVEQTGDVSPKLLEDVREYMRGARG